MRSAVLLYAAYPFVGLLLLLGAPVPFALLGLFPYLTVMPTIVAIAGIVVLFLGAWWDFGAKAYVQTLIDQHLPFDDEDLAFVYRRQFQLMLVYFGVAGVYLLVAVGMAYLSGQL